MKIIAQNLTVSYERHPALHHVNVEISAGTTAIIGPNGAGKTTFVKALLNEVKIETGEFIFENIKAQDIAYLAQISQINNDVAMSVYDVVMLGAFNEFGVYASSYQIKDIDKRINQALETVGLLGIKSKMINKLSRGQIQRVLFARIIMQNAQVIILDEPFNAMDSQSIEELIKIIKIWQGQGKMVLAILHDLNQVFSGFDNTIIFAKKLIASGKTTAVVNKSNLQLAYGGGVNTFNEIQCEDK